MPDEFVFFLLLVALILAFAFYGFIKFLIFLFRSVTSKPEKNFETPARHAPSLQDDVLGTSRILNFLRSQNRIDEETYQQLFGYLEDEFSEKFKLPKKLGSAQGDFPKSPAVPPTVVNEQIEVEDIEVEVVETPTHPPVTPEPLPAEPPPVPSEASHSLASAVSPQPSKPLGPAPWDVPDPPEPKPRRSFGEIMSGFMLEKNIRWGELASGILIVGSAVGLVVSLRNELRDTIPYFSALLFMLITAAIHGSGIYTLKKWKLRTTSRGTLLIGLLLIPLNFLAACILTGNETDRRELTDPLLWVAVVIGLSSFTAMCWFSSKCLLRRGQLPLVMALIGCGVGTLIINRAPNVDSSSLRKLLLSVPLVLSFLVGTAVFYKRQWLRVRWSERATNRLFVFLGLSTFAFLVASSMLIVRAEQKPAAIVALMPAFSVVALMTTWLGRIVWRGAGGAEQKRLSLTGLTLHILGLGLMAVSIYVSASNPTILLVNTAIIAVGLILFAKQQEDSRLLPAAWAAFALFVLCAVNLFTGKLKWDVWATASELGNALVSGQSGLSLLVAGAGVVGLHSLFGDRSKDQSRFMRVGLISGASIFLVGCGLALVASFVNRDNTFDTMTATSLLGLASLMTLAICVKAVTQTGESNPTESKILSWLPNAAAVTLAAFLSHAFVWNRTIQNWVNEAAFSIDANWILVFAMHSIILAVVAVVSRNKLSQNSSGSNARRSIVPELLAQWSAMTNALALVGIFLFIGYQTGLCTAIAVAISIVWLLLVWVQSNHRFGIRYWMSFLVAATGIAVIVFVGELVTKTEWCPAFDKPRFWLIQFMALAIWAAAWMLISWSLQRTGRFRKFADFDPRVEWALGHGLFIAAGLVVVVALLGGASTELFRDAGESLVSLAGDKLWMFAALGGIAAVLILAVFEKPNGITGAALVSIWFLCWGFGSEYFVESKSVGSALRWILPVGGAAGAILVSLRKPFRPAWAAARNKLAFRGKSTWPAKTTQTLINFALAIVVIVVLWISTVAITQVLMHGGPEALGGPVQGSWFGDLRKDVSYGVPVGIVVGTFLLYAISERRKWLATAGSAVFQYCVVLAVILLFLSPHPELASSWFVNILQSVSIGMTFYGFTWLYYKDRIEGHGGVTSAKTSILSANRVSQIEVHTLINGLLITSLATLVLVRFYVVPDQSGDWINTVGGTLGLVAWAIFGGLAFSVWREKLRQPHRTSTWMWLACWTGLVLVAMVAAFVDRRYSLGGNTIPWLTFRVIMWGAILVCVSQVGLLWLERRPEWVPGIYSERSSQRFTSFRGDQTLPLLFAGSIALSFAVRGAWLDAGSFWKYFAAIGALLGFLIAAGLMRRSVWLSFISAAVTALGAILLVEKDPSGWFSARQPYHANVLTIALVALALVWSGFYVYQNLAKQENIRRSFVWMPNLVLLFASIWVLLGSLAQWVVETGGLLSGASSLANTFGIGAMIGPVLLSVLHTWNAERRFQVISSCLWLTGLTVFVLAILIPETGLRNASILLGLGGVVTVWGLVWANRESYFATAKKLDAPALIRLERSMGRQLPIMGLIAGSIVLLWAFSAMLFVDPRAERYLAAMSPFAVAVGLGCMSDSRDRRWLQLTTLGLVTVGAVFVAWADLSPSEIGRQPMRMFVRALLVLAGAMFVYGGLVARWVRQSDTWLKSLREMAVATCVLALVCLGLVMGQEFIQFRPEVGCGMPVTEAIAVAVVVFGMIIGLILIAVRPKNDPFSLSLNGRMGYVYAAQIVAAMLVVHLYLTMPWLFQFGIRDYWPYVAIVLCFAGVGIARVLEQRELTVLGKPLFNTAAILPVVVALCVWGIDSKADISLVMLTVGLAYMMIAHTNRSILSGALAVVFGNVALWLFYRKLEGFAFLEHPQLWLIPPALSTLIAVQFSRQTFSRQQLAMIRYICITIIYISSTSEIFINGIGQELWPPVILAVLAVGGIMAGMMMQIRAYLYLGTVFLLLAMTSMVSHAHQRLDHVWPWWAFGIGMGVSILVMFGLFEKRKNDLKEIAGRMKEWDL